MKLTPQQKTEIRDKIKDIISDYTNLVKGIDNEAHHNEDRAYGGIIRAKKGKLVEEMTARMVQIAWIDVLKQDKNRLQINKRKVPINITDRYINRQEPRIRNYLSANKATHRYMFGTDVQVFIDEKLVLPIECKAYTENAMLKRILFDAVLTKEAYNVSKYYLVQLESQLGGDYSEQKELTYGSPVSHALMSHVDVDLVIITLLNGERDINRPIHKEEFFKELEPIILENTIEKFATALEAYREQREE